jgi:2-(1,2-epoxy-1,2-dihydrophenyl)acetyl-CoA isomerase
MDYETIEIERKGNMALLYLDRPEKLNALSDKMRFELTDFLKKSSVDEDVRVLILTGKGRAFSSGADLNMFKKAYEEFREKGEDRGYGGIELPKAFIDFPKPFIAAINGPAYGFGLTVSLTADIRIASDKAKFSCAFVRVGVTPEFGSSYFLPRLIGYGKAAELAFSARPFDAAEALEIGLVNRVVRHEDLLEEVEKLAGEISSMPAEAVMMTKRVLRHGLHSTVEQVLGYEGLVFRHCTMTKAHFEATNRILEKIKSSK